MVKLPSNLNNNHMQAQSLADRHFTVTLATVNLHMANRLAQHSRFAQHSRLAQHSRHMAVKLMQVIRLSAGASSMDSLLLSSSRRRATLPNRILTIQAT